MYICIYIHVITTTIFNVLADCFNKRSSIRLYKDIYINI